MKVLRLCLRERKANSLDLPDVTVHKRDDAGTQHTLVL